MAQIIERVGGSARIDSIGIEESGLFDRFLLYVKAAIQNSEIVDIRHVWCEVIY